MIIYLFKETKESIAARSKRSIFSLKEKQPVVEAIGTITMQPGQRLFIFDVAAKKLSPAIMQTNRLLMKPGCLYAPALNEDTAKKKFAQMLRKAYDKAAGATGAIIHNN